MKLPARSRAGAPPAARAASPARCISSCSMVMALKRGSAGWPNRAKVRASTLPSGALNDSRPESTIWAMHTPVIAFDRLAIAAGVAAAMPPAPSVDIRWPSFMMARLAAGTSYGDIHSRNDAPKAVADG